MLEETVVAARAVAAIDLGMEEVALEEVINVNSNSDKEVLLIGFFVDSADLVFSTLF